MFSQESSNKIVELLKKSAINFRNDFNKNLKGAFITEKKEDEIVVHFKVFYNRELEYLLIFSKQNNENIEVEDFEKLENSSNPYKQLHFTDENYILGCIFDNIKEITFEEIVCYKKMGIMLKNPLDLKGIYNIKVKYITD